MPRLTLWQRVTGRVPAAGPAVAAGAVPPTQRLVLRNGGTEPMEIMVEIIPDRYVLQPDDEMVIECDLEGAPFHITPYHLGMQIYPGNGFDPVVTINGVVVEPDWETPTPDSR